MSKRDLTKKQRQEEEATALAFEEFVQTFQANVVPHKTFVKSTVINARPGEEIGDEAGSIYQPKGLLKKQTVNNLKDAIECARIVKKGKWDKSADKPKTNLEQLKEELRLRHMERDERNKLKSTLSKETDCTSTNLFLTNINPHINESELVNIFGRHGALASVKILWPRSDEPGRGSSSRNQAFVAYMSRKDAERALHDFRDRKDMRVEWGKAVELPQHPLFVPPELMKLFLPPPYTGLPFNAQPIQLPFVQPKNRKEMDKLLHNSVVKVMLPMDRKVLQTVHRVIEFVVREGPAFEAMIMNRELNNAAYSFMFDYKNMVHLYYRWKLYSVTHGESQTKWSTKEFRMFKGGSIWVPPALPNFHEGMPDRTVSDIVPEKKTLSNTQLERLIGLIQGLTLNREKIADAMVFCINHEQAAKDILDVILDSFAVPSTKPPKKVARLYLLSDILYNSSMKKCIAPVFKKEILHHLETVFEHLHRTLDLITKAFDKESYKARVVKVLRTWEMWDIYPVQTLRKLETTFLGELYVEEPLKDDVDDNDSLNGEPIDEPLDGVSLLKLSRRNNTDERKLDSQEGKEITEPITISKWEKVEPDQLESQAMSAERLYNMELERQLTAEHTEEKKHNPYSEQEHEMRRRVEVLVVQYQDLVESGKIKLNRGVNLREELDQYRKDLLERNLKQLAKSGKRRSPNPETKSTSSRRKKRKSSRK